MRFQCQRGCTRCCEEKGFVYLSEEDVPRIAGFLGITTAEFEERYLYRTKNVRRLRKPKHAECPFLSSSGCTIHAAKPTQCSTFPLWPEILDDRKELAKTAKWCIGIGRGPHLSEADICTSDALMRRAYPHMYDE